MLSIHVSRERYTVKTLRRSLKFYTFGACTLWTAAVFLSLAWNIRTERLHALQTAKNSAVAVFNKDIAFRKWISDHGGVYVPVTIQTPPNPFLAHPPDRDIFMQNVRLLMLMNPAYALRQITREYEQQYGARGHITSLPD